MLVLSRKPGEKVIIGDSITLTVVAVSGNHVRVAFDAPAHIRILRAELADGQYDLMGAQGAADSGAQGPLSKPQPS